MKKCIISILLSFLILINFIPFASFAVAPVALVEAALASYVASTGYKIWVENGTGQDLLGFMSDLYSEFDASFSGQYMTMLELGSGNYVYRDNSGHIVLSKTAVDIFQDFSEWLQTEYIIPSDGTYTSVIVPSAGTLYYFGDFNGAPLYATKIDFNSEHRSRSFYIGSDGWEYAVYCDDGGASWAYLFYRSENGHDVLYLLAEPGTSGNFRFAYTTASVDYWLRTDRWGYSGSAWVSRNSPQLVNQSWVPQFPTSINLANVPLTPVSSVNLGAGLALSLGQSIYDKANDVANTDSMVIDVGAASGASDQAIVDAVIAGYNSTTGELSVTDSVVATEVIDTPVQPYPDVDSLGLPELGLALTTRFPFSIPWDISAIYSALSAPSEPPVKTFDLIPASVLARWGVNANTSITIDLTDQKYSVLLAIIHWSCIVGFCLGLAVMTKRYIWTTGG